MSHLDGSTTDVTTNLHVFDTSGSVSQSTKEQENLDLQSASVPVIEQESLTGGDDLDEVDDLEQYLVDPSEAREAESEPPAKRLKLNNGLDSTVSLSGPHMNSRLVLTAEPFDRAFSSPGFQGSSAIYFRLSLTEGSQHIIKKECSAVRYGLALWAKAMATLLDAQGMFVVLPGDEKVQSAEHMNIYASNPAQEEESFLMDDDMRPIHSVITEPDPGAPRLTSEHCTTVESSKSGNIRELAQPTDVPAAVTSGDLKHNSTIKSEATAHVSKNASSDVLTTAVASEVSLEASAAGKEVPDAATRAASQATAREQGEDSTSESTGSEKLIVHYWERQLIRIGLKYLEGLTYGLKKNIGSNVSDSSFQYESGHKLTICGLEFYQFVNKIIVSVISRQGQLLGRHVLDFLQQVQRLGQKLESGGASIKITDGNLIPPPPHHSTRTAKTYATLAAIGHLRAKKAANPPCVARAAVVSRALPAAHAPCLFSVMPPVPPPRMDLAGQPIKTWNGMGGTASPDPRFHNLPEWVISVINNLVFRHEGKLFSQLQASWLQTYGSHVDLMMWGFPSFQDLLFSMPGVLLRREKADFRVTLQRQTGWLDQSRAGIGWTNRVAVDMSVFVSNSSTTSKVPPEISTRLLLLLTEHNGCNIGHLQQLWRKECGEPLDFSSLGFAKFSDLLAEVPGITLRKEESTVTAHL